MVAHWARPGVRCVCIDDEPKGAKWATEEEAPLRGCIYTIKDAFIDDDGWLTFDLIEIERDQVSIEFWSGRRIGYAAWRFRPLVTRTQSQDIAEHFKKLLNTKAPIERAPLDIPMLDEVGQ